MQKSNIKHAKEISPAIDDLLARAHLQWKNRELRSAFHLFLAAAKRGDVTAQLDLGYFYDAGIGVKPNRSAAMQWYRRAYRQGHSSAASNIGTIFRDDGDTKRALLWFERAIRLGDADANLEIAKILIQKNSEKSAIPYLNRVVKARPRVDVTVTSREEAVRLLNKVSRDRPSNEAGWQVARPKPVPRQNSIRAERSRNLHCSIEREGVKRQ